MLNIINLVDDKDIENMLVTDLDGNEFSVYFYKGGITIYTENKLTVGVMSMLMVTLLNTKPYTSIKDQEDWRYNYSISDKAIKIDIVNQFLNKEINIENIDFGAEIEQMDIDVAEYNREDFEGILYGILDEVDPDNALAIADAVNKLPKREQIDLYWRLKRIV